MVPCCAALVRGHVHFHPDSKSLILVCSSKTPCSTALSIGHVQVALLVFGLVAFVSLCNTIAFTVSSLIPKARYVCARACLCITKSLLPPCSLIKSRGLAAARGSPWACGCTPAAARGFASKQQDPKLPRATWQPVD